MAGDDQAAPLITVVMATYAGDDLAHLEEAVDSILRQTHANLEFLISLDGPVRPETRAYLDALASRDGRVRLLPQSANRGPARARNAAFREAHGEYIAVMDADDVSAPDRLEKQLYYLRKTDSDLVGSFMKYINADGEAIGKKDMAVTHEGVRKTAILVNPINNPTAFARAAVFKDNPYDERFRRGQDYHLWARLIVKGYRLANVPEYLHSLRTGSTFFARRSRVYFVVSLRSRLILAGLYPFYLKPFALLLAVGLSSLRLLPGWCLRAIYWVRNNLRAGGGSGYSM
ncbi:MAG TPA: glycosyltransferase [Candidatus Hydrogenedentes bacterium]|nr:glycosyltransferase [Candidatus Hydrogenedentota bacterium]HIJ74778.1 glycosyltransferase [Candidatus Hydrogenedentota bacterium]